MGTLENKNKERARRKYLQQTILGTIRNAGLLGATLVAPQVLEALKKLGVEFKPRQKEYISSSALKLHKRGLLSIKNGYYRLTKEGERLLRRWELESYSLKQPTKWDRKWRMVIFDIPERKRKIRAQVSSIFNDAGFIRLQDSVWVYPYDCEDIVGLLKTDLGVGKNMLYIIADEIENDRPLRQAFKLM